MSTEVKEIFINPETGRLTTSTGAILTAPPTIIYAAQPEWDITIQRWRDGQAQPLDLSDATAWRFAVDRDLLVSTTPVMRTPDSGIDHSGAASGLIKVQLDSYTAGMLTLTDGRDSTPVWAELRGLNGDGMTVYCYRFRVNALGSVDPQGGQPPETPSGYATESYVAAMCRAGYEVAFSTDGESWHAVQTSADTSFKFRYPSGTWSTAVNFPAGGGENWQPLITSEAKLDYDLVSGTPDLTVYATTSDLSTGLAGKLDAPAGGTSGQFLMKNSTGVEWATPAGGGGGNYDTQIAYLSGQIDEKQPLIAATAMLDYGLLSGTPTIPTVNDATITFTQGGATKGTITLNQSAAATIAFDAGGGGGNYDTEIAYLSSVITGQAARIEALQTLLSGFSQELMSFTVSGNTVQRMMVTSGGAPAPTGQPGFTLTGAQSYTDANGSYTYNDALSAYDNTSCMILYSEGSWRIKTNDDQMTYYQLQAGGTGDVSEIIGTQTWCDFFNPVITEDLTIVSGGA